MVMTEYILKETIPQFNPYSFYPVNIYLDMYSDDY